MYSPPYVQVASTVSAAQVLCWGSLCGLCRWMVTFRAYHISCLWRQSRYHQQTWYSMWTNEQHSVILV